MADGGTGFKLTGCGGVAPWRKALVLPEMRLPLPGGRRRELMVAGLERRGAGVAAPPRGRERERGTSQESASVDGIPGILRSPGMPGIMPPDPGRATGTLPLPRPFLIVMDPGRSPRVFSASEWISDIVLALTCKFKHDNNLKIHKASGIGDSIQTSSRRGTHRLARRSRTSSIMKRRRGASRAFDAKSLRREK